jgi:iron complex outermembrane receptor protein
VLRGPATVLYGSSAINRTYGIPPEGTGAEITRIDLRQSKYDFKSELDDLFSFTKSLRMRLGYTSN